MASANERRQVRFAQSVLIEPYSPAWAMNILDPQGPIGVAEKTIAA